MTVQLDRVHLDHIHLDRDHIGAAVHALTDRVAALRQRRTQVAARVETLLATWHGAAADRFDHEWEQWRTGADALTDALEAEVAAMAATSEDVAQTDTSQARGAHALRSRLS